MALRPMARLGVILAELEARGELGSTLVVASGDHGIPGVPRAKCNLYDVGCEVALAARWPGLAVGRKAIQCRSQYKRAQRYIR